MSMFCSYSIYISSFPYFTLLPIDLFPLQYLYIIVCECNQVFLKKKSIMYLHHNTRSFFKMALQIIRRSYFLLLHTTHFEIFPILSILSVSLFAWNRYYILTYIQYFVSSECGKRLINTRRMNKNFRTRRLHIYIH